MVAVSASDLQNGSPQTSVADVLQCPPRAKAASNILGLPAARHRIAATRGSKCDRYLHRTEHLCRSALLKILQLAHATEATHQLGDML